MSRQTAINWLFKKLFDEPKDKLTWYAILEQAKEMEKEQIIESYDEAEGKVIGNGEKYYNKTFNN
jgi:hypothetical protein